MSEVSKCRTFLENVERQVRYFENTLDGEPLEAEELQERITDLSIAVDELTTEANRLIAGASH